MKKIIFILFIFSGLYAQCDEYNEFQCSNDNNCEWVENIEYGNCGSLTVSQCYDFSGQCYVDSNPGWYDNSGSYCTGGTYQIDNSYCEEIQILECSELDTEQECNHPLDGVDCQWLEDSETELVECSEFNNSENGCNNYPGECSWEEETTYGSCSSYTQGTCNNVQGCYWDCSSWYTWVCWCLGSEIITDNVCEGEYEIITGSCMEAYDLGDVNSDGTINVIDIVELVSIILNAEYIISGDFNQDGVNNIVDIISLVNIVLGVN